MMPIKKQLVIVIGAGPIGLYAALRLKKAGVKNVLVIDPRAGVYTRPGHINASVFERVYEGLGLPSKGSHFGHIKDIERFLYQQCTQYRVVFKRNKFTSLDKHSIVLEDGEVVNFDYLIDCSGTNRVVVEACNHRMPEKQPFSLASVCEVEIKQHFIAYVKLNAKTLETINLHDALLEQGHIPYDTAAAESLREYGWKYYFTPMCYGKNFGKGKACLYLEIPDDCPEEKQGDWVRAVIKIASNDATADFELLPPSSKYQQKPRFMAFTVNPHQLSPLYFDNIICLGDTIIAPDYRLAHGIEDGILIVDAFINSLTIIDQVICDFDGDNFSHNSQPHLQKHREALIKLYQTLGKRQRRGLENAKAYYDGLSPEPSNRETLLIKKAQIDLQLGLTLFKHHLVNDGTSIMLDKYGLPENFADIKRAIALINNAGGGMLDDPVKSQLLSFCMALKNTGSKLFRSRRHHMALQCYQCAKEFNNDLQLGLDDETQFIIESNLLLCRIQKKDYDSAIDGAKSLVEDASDLAEIIPSERLDKLLYNVARAIVLKLNNMPVKARVGFEEEKELLQKLWFSTHEGTLLLSDKSRQLLVQQYPDIMPQPVLTPNKSTHSVLRVPPCSLL